MASEWKTPFLGSLWRDDGNQCNSRYSAESKQRPPDKAHFLLMVLN